MNTARSSNTADAETEDEIDVSIVMPCLNEADTVGTCIARARAVLSEHGIVGEVVIADNDSSDGSPELAARAGARVVVVHERGYGRTLMAGIAAARGRYVLIG